MIRFFDLLISFTFLCLLSPLLLLFMLLISLESTGGPFYFQERVGLKGEAFKMFKFRTMKIGSDSKGLLTIGRDVRVTKVGRFLRKFKLDELPQLVNVLRGEMSLVGPRPEVEKYVRLYTDEQRSILTVKPGITDYASLKYFDENLLLAESDSAEETYVNEIMPAKIELNQLYINDRSILMYFKILTWTVLKIFSS